MRVWRDNWFTLALAVTAAPLASANAPAWAAEAAATAALDPSLVPGLRAELAAARAEAQAQMDKVRASDDEMNRRGAERDRWQAQIAEVDRDKALYDKNLADWLTEAQRYGAAAAANNARCGAVDPHDAALAAECQAEKANGDVWQANLKAAEARLDQAKADYLQRYDTIGKEIDQLSARISELFSVSMAARSAAAVARARAHAIEHQLTSAGLAPDGP